MSVKKEYTVMDIARIFLLCSGILIFLAGFLVRKTPMAEIGAILFIDGLMICISLEFFGFLAAVSVLMIICLLFEKKTLFWILAGIFGAVIIMGKPPK